MEKYLTSFTDIPYKAGTVNHATRLKQRRLLTYFGTRGQAHGSGME